MSLNPLSTLTLSGFNRFAAATRTDRRLLIDQYTNTIDNARYISSATNDYVMSSNGHLSGMNGIQQSVYLAATTTLGSAVQTNLGIQFPKVITTNFAQQIQNNITSSLSFLLNNGQISLNNISVVPNPGEVGSVCITINWTDLTTNKANITVLGGSQKSNLSSKSQFASTQISPTINAYNPATPKTLAPNLTLWLDAGEGAIRFSSGTTISTWTDLASNISFSPGSGVQVYKLTTPDFNGYPSILFYGNSYLSATVAQSQPFTMYYVGETGGGASDVNLVSSAGSGFKITCAANTKYIYTNGGQTLASVIPSVLPSVVGVVANGVNSSLFVNAASAPTAQGNIGTDALSGSLQVGSISATYTGAVLMNTLLVYSGAHSLSTVASIMNFLGTKYNIGIN